MARVAVQLYSAREQLAEDRHATLRRLADLGFTDVEPFGFDEDPDAWAEAIATVGLRAPSAHASLFTGRPDELLAAAARAGIGYLFDPWSTPENWADRASIEAFAAAFTPVAEAARDYGIRVGYHNHDAELLSRIEGRPALELFAELVHPEVTLEIDTYWAQAGGVEAVPLIRRFGDRVAALHLKDGDGRIDAHAQVALGRGDEPIEDILAAAPDALRVLEIDDPGGDVFDALSESLVWLRENDR